MEDVVYCLVDADGHVYMGHAYKDGAEFYSDAAAGLGLDERACQEYRFDLTRRELLTDRGTAASDRAVHAYVDRYLGTPEKLMACAEEGRLPKTVLMKLLTAETRQRFLEACASLEKQFTEDCVETRDPCLESGCALEGEDEVCLQPLVRAEADYHKACAAEWIKLFANPHNRIAPWRN